MTKAGTRAEPRAFRRLALGFLLLSCGALVTGCNANPRRTSRPTEDEMREAYFRTRPIVDEQGRKVPLGRQRAAVERKFGVAAIAYLRHTSRGPADCIVYPIYGTQVWDRYGAPEAAEWEFCFGPKDRLLTKRRVAVSRPLND
jgi:hypothetical protein